MTRYEEDGGRALQDAVARLPRAIEPPRDLWPGIAAAIAESPRTAAAVRPLPRTRRWAVPAAAAAGAFAAGLAVWLALHGAPAPHGPRGGAARTTPAVFAAAYDDAAEPSVDDLRRLYEQRRGELAPETVAVLERNLALIDEAVAASRAALARDPGSRSAGETLRRVRQQQIDFLRAAVLLRDDA